MDMDEAQVKYVLEQLDAGFKENEIKDVLTENGYSQELISQIFTEVKKRMAKHASSRDKEKSVEEKEIEEPEAESTPIVEGTESNDVAIKEKPLPASSTHSSDSKEEGSELPQRRSVALPIIFIGMALILFGTVAFASFAGLIKISNPFSGILDIFDTPPYDEQTLLPELKEGFSAIKSANYIATFSMQAVEKDSDTYLLPKESRMEGYEEGMAYLSYIPADLSASAEVKGNFELTEGESPDTYTRFSGEYKTDDFSFNADVELVLAKIEGLFIRINRMPSLFLFDFSSIKGDWVHVIDTPLGEFMSEEEVGNEEDVEQSKFVFEQLTKYQALDLKSDPEKTELNGEKVYKYNFTINQPAFKAFLEDTISELDERYAEDSILPVSEYTPEKIEMATNPAYIEYMNTHMTTHIWVGKDGIPRRLGITFRVAIDDDLVSRTVIVSEDSSKRSWLRAERIEAEIYYNENEFSYEGFCGTLEENSQFLDTSEWVFDCNDSETEYALDVLLGDGQGSECIDSTGYYDASSILLVGNTFCSSDVKNTTSPEPNQELEADRQVNIAFSIELRNINEPIAVEVPEDALTLEEAIEKVPALELFINEVSDVPNQTMDDIIQTRINAERVNAEIYFAEHEFTYSGFCDSIALSLEVDLSAVDSCYDAEQSYVLEALLHNGEYHCVDSSGSVSVSSFPQAEMTDGVAQCVDVLSGDDVQVQLIQ